MAGLSLGPQGYLPPPVPPSNQPFTATSSYAGPSMNHVTTTMGNFPQRSSMAKMGDPNIAGPPAGDFPQRSSYNQPPYSMEGQGGGQNLPRGPGQGIPSSYGPPQPCGVVAVGNGLSGPGLGPMGNLPPAQGGGGGPPMGLNTGPPMGQNTGPPMGQNTGPPMGLNTGPPMGQNTGPQNAVPQMGQNTGPPMGQNAVPQMGQNTGPAMGQNIRPPMGQNTGLPMGQGVPPIGLSRAPPGPAMNPVRQPSDPANFHRNLPTSSVGPGQMTGPPGQPMGQPLGMPGGLSGQPGPPGLLMGPPGMPGGPSGQPGPPGVPMGPPGMSGGPPGVSMGPPGIAAPGPPRMGHPPEQNTGHPGMLMGPPGMSMGPPGMSMGPPGMSRPPGVAPGPPGMAMGSPGLTAPPGMSMGPPGPHGVQAGPVQQQPRSRIDPDNMPNPVSIGVLTSGLNSGVNVGSDRVRQSCEGPGGYTRTWILLFHCLISRLSNALYRGFLMPLL